MRAVMVMYDSLNKNYLSPYGNSWVHTPNFQRLTDNCVTFDTFFAGSLPCMPARRELHTGRLNFLHRGWSPLEPFDESMPQILSEHGVYSHLISDHCHYWEDGGLNYHTRFTSFEYVRGQEGDAWASKVEGFQGKKFSRLQDLRNRELMKEEKNHSHVRCFEKGKKFLLDNIDTDNWYLQLEYFDPHEPFFAPERFKRIYTDSPTDIDWPDYRPMEDEDDLENLKEYKINYAATVSMCDEYLGRILDVFDEYNLWKDTLLIINTDHGYLLGEKGFVGKNYMPVYDEIANIPFFMHVPGMADPKGNRSALAQTTDIAPSILDWFGIDKGKHMLGESLLNVARCDEKIHDAVLYGYHGMHVNITDGKHTYFRCAQNESNQPLYQYTLMPMHIRRPMQVAEIKNADRMLHDDFEFTEFTPVLRIPVDEQYDKKAYYRYSGHMAYGSKLFNRMTDPNQENPISDEYTEAHLVEKMKELMLRNEAPAEQFVRLGFN